jgi:hypothetical protein
MPRGSLEGTLTTPPSDDNPFRTPDYAEPAGARQPWQPPRQEPGIPHWFTTKVRVTLAVCVVAALGLGVLGAMSIFWVHRSGPPSDGDCVYLSREAGDQLTYHRVGCGEDRATYKVDGSYRGTFRCGSGDYVRFRIDSSGTDRILCLALNVDTGDCLRDADDETAIAKVSCADPAAEERVVSVSGYGSGDACDGTERALTYSGPPRRTVCLTPTGENI